MHACASLLQEAFELLTQEEQTLKDEDLDRLESLSAQRAKLLLHIWLQRDGYDEEELRGTLLRMDGAHKEMTAAARLLHEKYREQRRNRKKQATYFQSDKKIHAEMQKSFYCDTVS